MEVTVLIHGAEATVSLGQWLGRGAIIKARVPKAYRHPALDATIRSERTRDEAHLLIAARQAGVPVPVLYDVDREGAVLAMEHVAGRPLRHVLEDEILEVSKQRFRHLGIVVAALHAGGVTHGDLTTSNIMVPDPSDPESLVLIDFGLGQSTREGEPRAVDLHLMEEALEATHPQGVELMETFLESYCSRMDGADDVVRRLEGVRERGRYRVAG